MSSGASLGVCFGVSIPIVAEIVVVGSRNYR